MIDNSQDDVRVVFPWQEFSCRKTQLLQKETFKNHGRKSKNFMEEELE